MDNKTDDRPARRHRYILPYAPVSGNNVTVSIDHLEIHVAPSEAEAGDAFPKAYYMPDGRVAIEIIEPAAVTYQLGDTDGIGDSRPEG